ncbi:Pantothenate synthetase [Frankliniella fusca]|uniref:Pantothenate synthetase n=1 Tax=Frankliniella fusca TaxID=407009 RepID=A0AAE1HXX6_9NEOP|nr:Pantothenate synthetase [Frankliniella fusca]
MLLIKERIWLSCVITSNDILNVELDFVFVKSKIVNIILVNIIFLRNCRRAHLKKLMIMLNDPFLNKFNEWSLQTRRANMDFSPIFSESVVYRYIAKYASKSEIKSNTYNDIMTDILDKKCVESEDCKKGIRKLLLSTCAERDYSAQEVIHFFNGDFVVINLKNRDWVSISYGFGSNNLIDNYINRPSTLEKLSIFELAKWYHVKDGEFKRRKRSAIVRFFPRLKKSFNEVEYYTYMSQIFYPWRSISDVGFVDENIKSHVDSCIGKYIQNCDIQENVADLEDPICDPSSKVKDNEQILSEFNPNIKSKGLGKTRKDVKYKWDKYSGKIRRDDVQIINEYLRKDFEIGFSLSQCLPDLNTEQLQFLHFIKLAVSKAIGMPGTGKSYLLKACVKYCKDPRSRAESKYGISTRNEAGTQRAGQHVYSRQGSAQE